MRTDFDIVGGALGDGAPDVPAETDSIGVYFAEAARIPLLTADQTRDLFTQLDHARRSGDPQRAELLKQRLAEANLRLVVVIAKRYRYSRVPLADRIQDGNIGLLDAIDRFDYRRGFTFATYAVWWIRRAILRGFMDTGRTVRLPGHLVGTLNKIGTARAALQHELGRDPAIEELAARSGMTPERLLAALSAGLPAMELDAPIADGTPLGAFVADEHSPAPDAGCTDADERRWLLGLLDSLSAQERKILEWRFGFGDEPPLTLVAIGARVGLSRERVRQIEKRAIARLRRRSLRVAA